MKRFRRHFGRVVSCVLSFVLLAGPISEGASLPTAVASPPADSFVATETVSPPSVETSPTIVRELVEERTENSRQLLLSDGTIRAEYFGRPIHYRDPATGAFEQADDTLVEATKAGRRIAKNKANAFTLEFPEDLSQDPVSLVTEKGSVSLRPVWTARPAQARVRPGEIPSQAASKVERAYPDAFQGATLEYESRTDGFKETIVVPERSPENVYSFELVLAELTPRLEEDGSISLLASGEVTPTITMPPPCMWDSAEGDEGAAFSDAVRYELTGSAPTWRLDVIADREWLDDPERVYPVLIDPGVITTTATPADTYISSRSGNQDTNFSGSNLVWVKHNNGGAWTEWGLIATGAALRQDLVAKKSNGYQVVGGRLRLYRYSIATPGSVTAQRVTTSFAVSTVTWNRDRPSAVAIPGTSTVPVGSGWHTFEVTEAFRHWQDNGTSVCALRLVTSNGGHMSFESVDYNSRVPVYQVDYAPVPVVSLVAPVGGGGSTSVPSAKWTYSEALGNPQVEYQVQVALTAGGTPVATGSGTGSVTECDLPTPSGGWQPGTTYHVRVRAASSPNTVTPRVWSEWSSSGSFTSLLPAQLEAVQTDTAASSGWFTETDTTGDGIPDVPNDSSDEGRGSVALSWESVPGATGYRVYLSDGNTFRQVGSTSSLTWTSAGAGLFPSGTAIAALAQGSTANPFLAGTGLDLRDDPRPLYAKTAGTAMNDTPAYAFKVVPYGVYGAPALADAVEIRVTLEGRTIGVNDAVRHASTEIGEFAEHSVEVVLDTGSMRTNVTDLSIASHGPGARLSRVYDSAHSDVGAFGPGWRFNFEQTIEASGTCATHFDESGDAHRFYLRDSTYHGPDGYHAELIRELIFPAVELGWRLRFRGGDSLLFDEAGTLLEERDANGNTVYYDRSVADQLSIWASNGQRILVSFDAGNVTGAVYSTVDGTREVAYSATTYPTSTGAANTCTYYPGTPEERTVNYDYATTIVLGTYYLSGISVEEIADAAWTFEAKPKPVAWSQGITQVGSIEWDLGRSATVVLYGEVCKENFTLATTAEIRESFEWNPTGTLARRSNPYAVGDPMRWRTFAYTLSGDITSEIDPAGHSRTWMYDTRGNVTSETNEEGATTTYVYGTTGGALDHVIEETSPSGSTTYRTYDANGNVLVEERVLNTEGERARAEWTYDASGRTKSEMRAISSTETVTTVFDGAGFAPSGEPLTVTHLGVVLEHGTQPMDLSEHTSYDTFGNVVSRTNAEGVVTETNAYTPAGYLVSSTDASGTASVSGHDALGRVTESWRAAGTSVAEKVAYTYDALGNVTDEDYYLDEDVAFSISHTVDVLGRVRITNHSIAGTTTRWHNASGDVVVEWSPANTSHGLFTSQATRTYYDAVGRVTQVKAPGGTGMYHGDRTYYSPSGNVTRTLAADGQWVDYGYDIAGNRTSETRPVESNDTVTDTFAYDLAGRLVVSKKAVGTENEATTTFAYDLLDRQVTAQLGQPSLKTYNVLGWILAEADFDRILTERVYDPAGRVVEERLRANAAAPPKTTVTAYDGLGRTVASTDPAGRTVRYEYDGFGRTTAEAHEIAGVQVKRTETAYDTLSRPISTAQSPAGVTSAFSYATASSTVSVAVIEHSGLTTTITYDSLGRETARTVTGTGVSLAGSVGPRDDEGRRTAWDVAGLPASAAYDLGGKVISQSGPGVEQATYTYDSSTGRKTGDAVAVKGLTSVTSGYTYDDSGRLGSAQIGAASWSYAFDERGNLETAVSGAVTTTFSVVDQNDPDKRDDRLRRSVVGGVVTTYGNDDLGRRISQTTGSVTTTYAYDEASRLVFWQRAADNASYTYDGNGQRTSANVTAGGTTTTTDYTYDGITLLSLDAARSDETTYAVAYLYDEDGRPYAGVYASSETSAPVTFLIAATDRGDVVALTNTAGDVFARYTYDPYGAVLSQDANATTGITPDEAAAIADRQPLRYAGYAYDAHSATYYLSQRHYDPATMRFLTKDPARDDGEESAYQYCAGNPVGKVDPTGLASHTSAWSPWRYLGVNVLLGNWASFEFRSRVTWRWNRPRISATVEVATRNGKAAGTAISVLRSDVKAWARVVKSPGREYSAALGTLNYGIRPEAFSGHALSYSGRSGKWTSTTYSTYWIKYVEVWGTLRVTGGLGRPKPYDSRGAWHYNPYGVSRPR